MELMQEEVKGYSDSREEEEEEEATTEEIITREENSSRLLHQHQDAAGSNFIINNNNNNNHHHHQNQNHQHNTKQLDFMDLSLGTSIDNIIEGNLQGSGGGGFSSSNVYAHHNHQHHQHASGGGSSSANNVNNNLQQQQPAEKEHMFDKVVTPSDVGKLNRLVIPKQHAEKYFPLDSSANEKGLLLNFEDRNGKLWRFRYSYWNSSQSYVMTKGWSRFVKEKKLDAGDIVSFQRGVGEMFRHRLYIDWRRRPDHHHHHHGPDPSTTLFTPFFLPNQPHLMSIRWGATSAGRLYSLPSPTPQHLNYNNTLYHHQQQQQQQHPFHHHGGGGGSGNGSHHYNNNYHDMMSSTNTSGSGSVFYLRSTPPSMPLVVDHRQTLNSTHQQQEGGNNVSLSPMIIDSVPVAHNHHHHHHQYQYGGKSGSSNITSTSTAGKRLRLFGVNMECASSTSEDPKCFSHVTMANSNSSLSSSSLPSPLQLLREDTTTLSSSSPSTTFGDQRGEASMLFDLDPSLQYRQ